MARHADVWFAARRHELSKFVCRRLTPGAPNLERSRPIELDAIVGAVAELGGIVGVDTLMVDAMYALTRRKARVDGH
jgi:hypothetical protein